MASDHTEQERTVDLVQTSQISIAVHGERQGERTRPETRSPLDKLPSTSDLYDSKSSMAPTPRRTHTIATRRLAIEGGRLASARVPHIALFAQLKTKVPHRTAVR